MEPSDCGTPKTFTGAPETRLADMFAIPEEVVMSCGLTVMVPPGMIMPKLPLPAVAAQLRATVPRGMGLGRSTAKRAAQPLGFAGSFHVALLRPKTGIA